VVEPFSFAKSLHRGQRYNIMCTVTRGDLPVTIRWFKDGRLLANGGQQYLSADLAERTSSSGLAEQQQQQLELQQQLQQQLSDQQHSAELAAQQQQLQQQQLQLQLQPAGIAVKQLDPYSSTLTFASLQAHHRGQYSCEAANEAGQANQSSTLMIHGEYWRRPVVSTVDCPAALTTGGGEIGLVSAAGGQRETAARLQKGRREPAEMLQCRGAASNAAVRKLHCIVIGSTPTC